MAANEDKSIVLGVDLNISQAERELAKLKNKVSRLENSLKEKQSKKNSTGKSP